MSANLPLLPSEIHTIMSICPPVNLVCRLILIFAPFSSRKERREREIVCVRASKYGESFLNNPIQIKPRMQLPLFHIGNIVKRFCVAETNVLYSFIVR